MSFQNKIIVWNMLSVILAVIISALLGGIMIYFFLVARLGYFTSDPAKLILIMDRSFLSKLLLALGLAFCIALWVSNLIISASLSKSFIKPLKRIREMARELEDSTSNDGSEYYADDEIGRLYATFFEMRQQLILNSKKLLEADKQRLTLISGISHDLRTPLTTIIGYTDGILDNIANTQEKRLHYLNTIKSKALYMQGLIESLLLSSKTETGAAVYSMNEMDLLELTYEVFDEISQELLEKNISYKITCKAKEHMVKADRQMIKRVFLNIIGNCINYKSEEGHIEVELENHDECILLKISDNGIGIDESHVPYVFDSFYRCDPARTSKGSNSGLGLYIAKNIIQAHHGKIWLRSKPGLGTTVYITLVVSGL